MKKVQLAGASSAVFLSDGSLLVTADDGVHRVEPKTGRAKRWMRLNAPFPVVMCGDGVLVGDDAKVLVVKPGKKPRVTAKYSVLGESVMSIAASADGKHVLAVGSDEGGVVKCFELGRPRARWTIGARYAKLAWFPSGTRFLTAQHEWSSRVRLHDGAKGETLIDFGDPHPKQQDEDEPAPSVNDIAVESEESILLASDLGLMRLSMVDGAKPQWLLSAPQVNAVERAGDRWVAGCEDGKVRVLDASGNLLETIAIGSRVGHVTASANGDWACVTENAVWFA